MNDATQTHWTAEGGKTLYGASVGILMLDSRFPRIPGDTGNALTWPFPVLYKVVSGASPDRVVKRQATGLVDAFVEGAQELVRLGADGITTTCGFLSLFQRDLAERCAVPVATSSLMQVPFVERILPPGRRVGVVTISAESLTPEHLAAAGVSQGTPVVGVDPGSEFARAILEDRDTMDIDAAEAAVVAAAQGLVEGEPDVGAIVLECTNMVPYAAAVRRRTGRPVFDIYSFVTWFQSGLAPREFRGREVEPVTGEAARSNADPATLEIVGNYLVSAVREMGRTLMRTAYSTILRESMDCTTALFDPDGQLIAQADHVPSHQGSLSHAAKHIARTMTLDEGDVVIVNHPYLGGTHHPDIMVFKPVFHAGRAVAIAGALGHHIDVGGRSPGSVGTDARDVFEEGIMIPPMKLYRRGKPVEEILQLIEANIRVPHKTLGDIRAEIAAINVGERRYLELVERHGVEPLAGIVAACLERSERLMREDLARIPDGTYEAVGFMDHDGITDEPVRIQVAVTVDDGAVTVDYTGSSPQLKGPFNCSASSVQAATFCSVRYMASPSIMQNEGCYRPVTIVAPEGTLVHPVAPAPLSGRFHTMERIANTILMAFNEAVGEGAVGSTHAHMSSYSVSGRMPGSNRGFVCFEILGGGWGGTRTGDGLDATFGLMANCLDTPVEALEMEYPLRVERYALRPDSGGAGTHRGGLGLDREVTYLCGSGYFTNRSDATRFPPAGARGGGAGATSTQRLLRGGERVEALDCKATNLEIEAGDVVVMQTAGGGGWGDPHERPAEAVRDDVIDGKIGVAAARELYGVAIGADGETIDAEATAALRGR